MFETTYLVNKLSLLQNVYESVIYISLIKQIIMSEFCVR